MKNDDNKQKFNKEEMEKVFKGMSLSKSEEEVIKGGYTIDPGTNSWICFGNADCRTGCITSCVQCVQCNSRCFAGECYHATSFSQSYSPVVEG